MEKKIWRFIEPYIVVVGLVLSIWSIFFASDKRELSYEIVSTTEVGTLQPEYLPGIQISYGGKSIERGGVTTIRITNTGDSPIYPKEFDGSIGFHLDSESKFIGSKIVNILPNNLKPSLSLNNGIINMAPLLLNSGDEVTIQAIAEGNLKDVRVTARIGGISEIKDINEGKRAIQLQFSWLLLVYAVLCFVALLLVRPIVFNGGIALKDSVISRQGAILIIAICMVSGEIALNFFLGMHNIGSNWLFFMCIFCVSIVSEFIARFFRPKQKSSTGDRRNT